MIVRMKKVVLVTQDKDATHLLEKVRKLRLLHIEHINPPKGDKLDILNNDSALLKQAISLLNPEDKTDRNFKENTSKDWCMLALHIIDLHKRYLQLNDYSVNLISKIESFKEWGDFEPQDLESLRASGISARLFKLSDEQIEDLPKGVYLWKVSKQGGINNCLLLSEGEVEIPFKEIEYPKDSLSKMQARFLEDNKVAELIKKELLNHVVYLDFLKGALNKVSKEIEFYEAFLGMSKEEGLLYIKGYIPFDSIEIIENASRQEGWGFLITDPSDDDNVPTLVRNPKWINIINPVFRVIEVIPGYKELDISLWFLIFFSIFFGILIGDAGYGAVYFLFTLLAQKKWQKNFQDRSVFILLYILSGCAVTWGLLTATFFGQEWLPAWFKPLMPFLRNDKNMQAFCFFLGALHLSIAHGWRAMIKFPALSFLADIGWTLILWTVFFIAKMLVLGDALPEFYLYLLVPGILFVVFFSHPQKNIIKAFGSGLGALLLNIMNNFTDVVSYIRLFAVGLATLAVADAFNNMASDIGFSSLASGFLTSIILLVGHILNIILGPLSILVHGVRLNVLEFCSHLDIKWSGFSYKPLTEK